MAYLYVTTDALEAEALVENTKPGQKAKYAYHDIGVHQGRSLMRRVGFNPMCYIDTDEDVCMKELDSIAARLVKAGLYVAIDMIEVQRYTPKNVEERSKLVKLAVQKGRQGDSNFESTLSLLCYSNNPDQIRELGFS